MALSRLSTVHYGAIVGSSTLKPWDVGYAPRKSVAESLVVHLSDPKTKEELLILGTSNISTSNAYRNFELAEKFAPSSILIQASPTFGKFCFGQWHSSEEFQNSLMKNGYYWDYIKRTHEGTGIKSALFETRKALLSLWMNTVMRTPQDIWRLFVPGLDTKMVFDLSAKLKADVHYAGEDFNCSAMEMLYRETRMDVIYPYLKYYFGLNEAWEQEARNWQVLFRSHPIKALAEGHFNQDNVAWLVKFAEKMIPHQKGVIIDKKNEDIFWSIERNMKGSKKLILVNQWHMDGVQKLWRKYHGLEASKSPMMSTHDLPLEEVQAWMRGKDYDRKVVEKRTGVPMAQPNFRENTSYWDDNRSHYA